MFGELSSQCSTPASEERAIVFHLILVTLAGDEIQLAIDLREFDRLGEFENVVIDNLIGEHSTFGCELEFVSGHTQKIFADPIWDTLHEIMNATASTLLCAGVSCKTSTKGN